MYRLLSVFANTQTWEIMAEVWARSHMALSFWLPNSSPLVFGKSSNKTPETIFSVPAMPLTNFPLCFTSQAGRRNSLCYQRAEIMDHLVWIQQSNISRDINRWPPHWPDAGFFQVKVALCLFATTTNTLSQGTKNTGNIIKMKWLLTQ